MIKLQQYKKTYKKLKKKSIINKINLKFYPKNHKIPKIVIKYLLMYYLNTK